MSKAKARIQKFALRMASVLVTLAILLGSLGQAAPAMAAGGHNPNHNCEELMMLIRGGRAGGTYLSSPDGLKTVWTDLPGYKIPSKDVAAYVVAIFYEGASCSMYHLEGRSWEAAWRYVKDKAALGGAAVSAAQAVQQFKSFAVGVGKAISSAPIIIVWRGLFECLPGKDRRGNPVWYCPPGMSPPPQPM